MGKPEHVESFKGDEHQHEGAEGASTEKFGQEWQKSMTDRQMHDRLFKNGGADRPSERLLPNFAVTTDSEHVHDTTVRNSAKGTSDTLAAISPRADESLAHLIKRLHPDLSDEQLSKEVEKVLKYNRDYGNDLGDGAHLDGSRQVFLTSVKYVDDRGRITRIEGPTGRVTEISYDAGGVAGYKITEADGKVCETVEKGADGSFVCMKDGVATKLKDVDIDIYGDITTTDTAGNKVGHLTRGDDVYTTVRDGKPFQSTTVRNGQEGVVFEYVPVEGGVNVFARYPDDPTRRVPITAAETAEQLKRVILGTGYGPQADSSDETRPSSPRPVADLPDVAADDYVANCIVRSAISEANSRNTVGWCYAGVADALDRVGVHLHGESAYMAADQLRADGRFQVVSLNDVQPGDVLVHGRASGHKHGHIAVYLGKGKEASDHIQGLIRGQGYGGTTVFRYVGRNA